MATTKSHTRAVEFTLNSNEAGTMLQELGEKNIAKVRRIAENGLRWGLPCATPRLPALVAPMNKIPEEGYMKVQILYILGSTRSGTSALRNALCQTRFAGDGEGHLVPLLLGIMSVVRQQKLEGVGCKIEGNGLFYLRENVFIRHMFHAYESYLRESIGVNTILDKTPTIEPIRAAPELNIFHEAPFFVHCARRHVDNILSKQKKFPHATFTEHCLEWAQCNKSWLDSKTQLNGNFVDFDYYDLVNKTHEICKRIGAYLELTDDEVGAVEKYLVSMRPESAEGRDLTQFKKLSEVPWDDRQKEEFVSICGAVGEQLGYGFEEYFA